MVNLDKLSDGLPAWLGEMKLAFWRTLEFKMLNPASTCVRQEAEVGGKEI